MTIPEISKAEGLSIPNVAKLMRLLRMGGVVKSVRGQAGGYTLSKPADQVPVSHVMEVLGGQFFGPKFCDRHAGRQEVCTHFTDCSLRSLWNTVQLVLHEVLGKTTLQDLLCNETQMSDYVSDRAAQALPLLIRNRAQAPAERM
jgi:Rrf2 family protein